MRTLRGDHLVVTLLVGLSLLLGACGGKSSGGGGGGDQGFLVTGDLLVGDGDTGHVVTDLAAAPGARVDLLEIDVFGAEVTGTPLATTVADAWGSYGLRLPAGLAPAANLMLKITINDPIAGVVEARAVITGATTNVSAYSDYALERLTTGGNTLANATPAHVLALQSYVREADVGFIWDLDAFAEQRDVLRADFAGDATILGMLAQARLPAGDAAHLSDVWSFVELGTGMGSSGDTWTFTAQTAISGTLGAGGATTWAEVGTYREAAVTVGATPAVGGGLDYWLDFDLTQVAAGGGMVESQVANDGSLIIAIPGQYDFGEPGEAAVSPAHGLVSVPLGNSSGTSPAVYVSSWFAPESGFAQGDPDSVDYGAPLWDDHTFGLTFVMKREPIAGAAIHGNVYGAVGLYGYAENTGDRYTDADLVTLTVDATSGEIAADGVQHSIVRRAEAAGVGWYWWTDGNAHQTPRANPWTGTFTYDLDPMAGIGVLFPERLPEQRRRFYVGNGGDCLMLTDHDPDGETAMPPDARTGLTFGVRLPDGVPNNPAVAGNAFSVLLLGVRYEEDGGEGLVRAPGLQLDIQAETGADNVSIQGLQSWRERDGELAGAVFGGVHAPQGDEAIATFAWGASPGQATIVYKDGLTATGYMNVDGDLGVFLVYRTDLNGTDGSVLLGMAILVKK